MKYKICIQVGNKIRKVRNKLNISQEELAGRSGIHSSTLGRIERGESNVPLYTLFKIAQALRINLKEIFIFN